ncbi:hypothetical protein [Conexibacter sp. SYSU D00693]|uniref:hypothetical protein n=1 Tax=Conexibacter sp. SYSU D00693 TaxID=2812560 RepID=UPI00196B9FA8|nr:hypothetical protein [Conexibacter sp. SYSU D00693]
MDSSLFAVDLRAPLPNDDLEARLAWRAPRQGMRPGDRDVPRDVATYAVLWTRDLAGRERERRLTVDEGDAYLAQVEALHAKVAQLDADVAAKAAVRRQRAADTARTIDLTCPHCGVARVYEGRRDLQALERPEHVARTDDPALARPRTVALHLYACPRCGSAELFTAGPLQHPLDGAA